MLSIQLLNLAFYAYHGVHKEERKLGAEYEVNVCVSYTEQKIPVLHLSETIDYTSVYGLVKQHMLAPQALLETVATQLAAELLHRFPLAEEVSINIIKKHPPLVNFKGSVAVTYSTSRKNNV